ncbi:MAG: choice-of-anchor tandem repeat GloVer-containing protein [Luteolibacter sp.]
MTKFRNMLMATVLGTSSGMAVVAQFDINVISGMRVSANAATLPVIEAESGTLGSEFTVNLLASATNITVSPTSTSTTVPGSAARVASYSVPFPAADTYQLYARVRVGPDGFNDDSFFHGNGLGAKSPTTASNWIFANGLAAGGFTAATDVVTAGGGSAGIQVWKWMKFATLFTVPSGSLTQTFQVGGREDGFSIDKFIFAPSSVSLTVGELDSGNISPPPEFVTFDGPDGIAIHRFGEPNRGATPDGANPASELVLIGGNLQGTTLNGGLQGEGAAFRVGLDGSSFETLENFNSGTDMAHPQGGLLMSGGGFFGVSQAGGAAGSGTVFERKADGTVAIIRSFNAVVAHTGTNVGGANPSGKLAISGSALYGATFGGGTHGNGTVFWVSTGGVNFTVLKEFTLLDSNYGTNVDGARPRGGVVLAGGRLYGTTTAGGTGGSGVVFAMDVNGANYTILHHFSPLDTITAANTDGAMPSGSLVISNGVIYGTTISGGAGGRGTVFAIHINGTNFLPLYSFSATDMLAGTNADGASPAAGLHLSGNVLYGTASSGGAGAAGTVFALDPFMPEIRTFHSFEPLAADGTNQYGSSPVAPLLRVGHALFGTAFAGGPGGSGTVFRIQIPLTARVSAVGNFNSNVNATLFGRGAPNSSYIIQATNDLTTAWQTMGVQSADSSGLLEFPETNLSTPKRFYRIVEAP